MNRADDLIAILRAAASPEHRSGMSRFGIPTERALGIAVPALRKIARETGTDHPLAVALWDTAGTRPACLAPMIADPRADDRRTRRPLDATVRRMGRLRPVLSEPVASHRVRLRAGRAIRSARGGIRPAHGLRADGGAGDRRQAVADERFLPLLGLIGKAADDPRNFVKKAVNWALRQIGKRSLRLHGEAVGLSRTLASSQDRTARWIGRDALRELTIRKRSPGSGNKAGKRVGGRSAENGGGPPVHAKR